MLDVDRGAPAAVPATARSHVKAWFAWSVASAATLAAIHYWLADPGQGPRIFADEIGYLANARFLAGGAKIDMSNTAFYSGGFSLILTPLNWALLNHPARLYQSIILGQAMLAGVSMLLMAQLCRWILGISKGWSLVVAFAAGLYPAFVANTGFTWAESMLTFALLVVVTTSIWVLRGLDESAVRHRNLVLRAAAAGFACGALPTMHNRTFLAALAALVIVSWSLVRARSYVPAGILLATAAVTALAGELMNLHLKKALWIGRGGVDAGEKVTTLLHPHGLWAGGLTLSGQAWYQLVSSAGLVAVALVGLVLIALGRAEPRDTTAVGGASSANASRAGAAIVVAAFASLLVVSAAFLATGKRADQVVYGRYVDIATPLLIALAIAWLATSPSVRALAGAAFAVVASLGATFLILTWAGKTELARPYNRVTTLGIIGWLDFRRTSPALFRATAWSVGIGLAAIAIAYVARADKVRAPAAIAVICLGVAIVFSWQLSFLNPKVLKPLAFGATQTRAVVAVVNGTHVKTLRLEPSITVVDRLALEYWLPKVRFSVVASPPDRCSAGLAITRLPVPGSGVAPVGAVGPFSIFEQHCPR
jgi:hypothetical protein